MSWAEHWIVRANYHRPAQINSEEPCHKSCRSTDAVASAGLLDKALKWDFSLFMKGTFWLMVGLWLATIQIAKPQLNFKTAPQAVNGTAAPSRAAGAVEGTHVDETNAVVRKRITVGGPLVQPFKSKPLREVPKRLWHLINPLAPTEPKPAYEPNRVLSTRAWSTTVGWTPGRSAFPDEVTHESTMSLISFSRTQ
jgi:hypothetical protein